MTHAGSLNILHPSQPQRPATPNPWVELLYLVQISVNTPKPLARGSFSRVTDGGCRRLARGVWEAKVGLRSVCLIRGLRLVLVPRVRRNKNDVLFVCLPNMIRSTMSYVNLAETEWGKRRERPTTPLHAPHQSASAPLKSHRSQSNYARKVTNSKRKNIIQPGERVAE